MYDAQPDHQFIWYRNSVTTTAATFKNQRGSDVGFEVSTTKILKSKTITKLLCHLSSSLKFCHVSAALVVATRIGPSKKLPQLLSRLAHLTHEHAVQESLAATQVEKIIMSVKVLIRNHGNLPDLLTVLRTATNALDSKPPASLPVLVRMSCTVARVQNTADVDLEWPSTAGGTKMSPDTGQRTAAKPFDVWTESCVLHRSLVSQVLDLSPDTLHTSLSLGNSSKALWALAKTSG